jgi:hypothetical protein
VLLQKVSNTRPKAITLDVEMEDYYRIKGAALQISHESTVVFLLRKLLKDAVENIDYYIYELDYGRKYEPGMITDENGHDIDFSSAEKLYDYLIGEVK